MELSTALNAFQQLEGVRDALMDGDPPVYNVRLDATSGRVDGDTSERDFRLRITAAHGYGNFGFYSSDFSGRDALQRILDVARESGIEFVELANNGIELY